VKSLVGGGLLVLLATFMLWGFFRSTATLSSFATIMALGITVALPGIAGIALIARHLTSGRKLDSRRETLRLQTLQSEILRLAGQRGGRLALVEIMTEMAVDTPTAQAALDGLLQREVADVAVTDSGGLIYTFRDIERLHEKPQARGVLE
jgi:hypothetical protein